MLIKKQTIRLSIAGLGIASIGAVVINHGFNNNEGSLVPNTNVKTNAHTETTDLNNQLGEKNRTPLAKNNSVNPNHTYTSDNINDGDTTITYDVSQYVPQPVKIQPMDEEPTTTITLPETYTTATNSKTPSSKPTQKFSPAEQSTKTGKEPAPVTQQQITKTPSPGKPKTQTPQNPTTQTIIQSRFYDVPLTTYGDVSITKKGNTYELHLNNFKTWGTSKPQLYVSAQSASAICVIACINTSYGFLKTTHLSLGELQKTNGNQTYTLPGFDPTVYKSVVIYSPVTRLATGIASIEP